MKTGVKTDTQVQCTTQRTILASFSTSNALRADKCTPNTSDYTNTTQTIPLRCHEINYKGQ